MSFPVLYLLIPFAVIVLLAGLFLFFNIFHVLRFGIESTGTYAVAGVYVAGFAILLLASAILLSRYDWNKQINPAAIINFNNPSGNIYGL